MLEQRDGVATASLDREERSRIKHRRRPRRAARRAIERAPAGPQHYPEEWTSYIPQDLFVAETIREKVMLLCRDEIPHQVRAEVDHLVEEPDGAFRITAPPDLRPRESQADPDRQGRPDDP